MIRWLSNLIALQEKREFRGETVVFFAVFVGAMRLVLEMFLVGYQAFQPARDLLMYASWYMTCFFAFGLPVRLLAPAPWQKRINVMLVGLFLGFMPPVVDVLVGGWGGVVIGHDGFSYAYVKNFPEGWPWGMIDPAKHMPIGEGVVLWAAVFFTGAYLWLRTKSAWRTMVGIALAYGACAFVGGIFPTLALNAWKRFFRDESFPWLLVFGQVICTLFLYLVVYRPSVGKHVLGRFVHALPLIGVSLVGYAWIRPLDRGVLSAVSLISLSGIVTILENDHWDDVEERADQPERVTRYDLVVVYFTWAVTTLTLFAMGSALGVLTTIYGIASYLYNSPLYRGKRYFPANLKLEGLWGGVAFLVGVFAAAIPALVASAAEHATNSRMKPWMRTLPISWAYEGDVAIAALLAFGGWSVLASMKDEKDVATDARVGSHTVFTLLVRRGTPASVVARRVRTTAFVCLLVGAWAPMLVERVDVLHALAMTALAVPVAFFQGNDASSSFRVRLVLVTCFLFVLAHGVSLTHG